MIERHLLFAPSLGQPDIVVAVSVDLEGRADWIADYLDAAVDEGARFREGETLATGWSVTKFVSDDRGRLELHEPSFGSFPIRWVRGVDRAVRDHLLQSEACGQFDVEPEFPTVLQTAMASAAFLSGSREFLMRREDAADNDSGWMFIAPEDSGDDLQLHSLYAVAVAQRFVTPFLALPPGASVSVSAGEVVVELGGRTASSQTNAYLKQLIASSYR